MIKISKLITSKKSLLERGETLFHYGILFLPILLPISLFLLLTSLIISLSFKKINFKDDKWNQLLLLLSGIIIFNSLRTLLFDPIIQNSDNFLIIIFNAFKWILLFLSFAGFQNYLKTSIQKVNFVKFLILDCVPIILSCFLQHWFKIYGPFEFLNGLIVWYNKPPLSGTEGVSGLFSNQNYTGFWLSIIWPFCIYSIRQNKVSIIKKSLLIMLAFSIIYLILMTTSRGAILGILIMMPMIFSFKFILCLIILILLVFSIANIAYFTFTINDIFLPEQIKFLAKKLTNLNYIDIKNSLRVKIWSNTLSFIYSKPIFGFGAGLYPLIYLTLNENYNSQHAHNIILQIAFEYGLFLSLFLSSFIFILLFRSWSKIFLNSTNYSLQINSIEIFWFAASFVAITSQLYDVTYFEGKISILIWILMAGLKTINDEKLIKSKILS